MRIKKIFGFLFPMGALLFVMQLDGGVSDLKKSELAAAQARLDLNKKLAQIKDTLTKVEQLQTQLQADKTNKQLHDQYTTAAHLLKELQEGFEKAQKDANETLMAYKTALQKTALADTASQRGHSVSYKMPEMPKLELKTSQEILKIIQEQQQEEREEAEAKKARNTKEEKKESTKKDIKKDTKKKPQDSQNKQKKESTKKEDEKKKIETKKPDEKKEGKTEEKKPVSTVSPAPQTDLQKALEAEKKKSEGAIKKAEADARAAQAAAAEQARQAQLAREELARQNQIYRQQQQGGSGYLPYGQPVVPGQQQQTGQPPYGSTAPSPMKSVTSTMKPTNSTGMTGVDQNPTPVRQTGSPMKGELTSMRPIVRFKEVSEVREEEAK